MKEIEKLNHRRGQDFSLSFFKNLDSINSDLVKNLSYSGMTELSNKKVLATSLKKNIDRKTL